MRRLFCFLITLLAWFAVVIQFVLLLQNTTVPLTETIIRFFSFFTILTNTLVAFFFTGYLLNRKITYIPGHLTAITSYILVVGLVYQFLLRHLWSPSGMQFIVDELLHSVVPVLVLVYWFIYEQKQVLQFSWIKSWLYYPLVYFIYILIRGALSGYYPYPFIDVNILGYGKALAMGIVILVLFVIIQALLVAFGRRMLRQP
ncbi:MAG: Pr6Pr family membrane protein [Chitinophagaceae bacterium]|nr:Pr6Pr family membrane protein [Chitinophagaceae bacterium]MCW5928082.1 Pr6Pr family membrane protein [Chitinophagaceae bacterium]